MENASLIGKSNIYFVFFTLILSVLQVYTFPVFGNYIPLALLACFTIFRVRAFEKFVLSPIGVTCVALLGMQALSLLWSPDVFSGIRDITFEFAFILCVAYFSSFAVRNYELMSKVIGIYCLIMLISSASIVLFRFNISIEASYWRSFLSDILINPNVMSGIRDGSIRNNVFDPEKSGGLLFINANTAGMLSGMTFFATVATLGQKRKSPIFWLTLAVHCAAVLCCGSKASLAVIVLAPAFAWYVYRIFSVRSTTVRLIMVYILPFIGASIWAFKVIVLDGLTYFKESNDTLAVRSIIWEHAWDEFLNSPVFGQGYGGWAKSFLGVGSSAGISDTYPPHNAIIILWSQSGLIAAVLGVAFIFLCFKNSFRSFRYLSSGAARSLFAVLFVYFFQIMGENMSLISELHSTVLLAGALALILASRYSTKIEIPVVGRPKNSMRMKSRRVSAV